ncbi:hypothetical protein [uncultured Veillonella sp.]|uniref:hypothetical protein n=1 Tax=uncultured Veillonella sp. TaxID=159268 RepID=UPI00258EB1E5|nr:hypothetical protein [uncultured Veillonella sp.]
MGYIEEAKAFDELLEFNDLSTPAVALWYALLNRFNRSGWQKDITVSISTLQAKTKLSPAGVKRARNQLKQAGVIDFTSRKGNLSTIYHFVSLAATREPQTEPHSEPQADPHGERNNKTRLDKTRLDNGKENIKKKSTRSKPFVKPTREEVRAYCIERGNDIDPDKFYDYYESNGWMVGKSKMKDWKAAVRTWERNSKQWNLFSAPAKKSNAVDLTKKMLEKYGGVKDADDY